MSLKKGTLWTLYVALSLVFEFRVWISFAWLILGLAVCLPDRWWLWTVGFVSIAVVEGAIYALLNGGPLDPRRLCPDGNFAE
jgi:hypothetical protein